MDCLWVLSYEVLNLSVAACKVCMIPTKICTESCTNVSYFHTTQAYRRRSSSLLHDSLQHVRAEQMRVFDSRMVEQAASHESIAP